jgi:hypothetical protein
MGICSGTVTRNGYPVPSARVSGSVGGFFGGMTETVYTDGRGRFVLEWSGNSSLSKLYVNGNTAERDVCSGDKVHIDL